LILFCRAGFVEILLAALVAGPVSALAFFAPLFSGFVGGLQGPGWDLFCLGRLHVRYGLIGCPTIFRMPLFGSDTGHCALKIRSSEKDHFVL